MESISLLKAHILLNSSTFNFSVPELSWLTACLLLIACLVLHYVPIRVLLLLWGLVKFSRRLVRPHSVPNNEVLDLLSRVPDDEEIVSWMTLLSAGYKVHLFLFLDHVAGAATPLDAGNGSAGSPEETQNLVMLPNHPEAIL